MSAIAAAFLVLFGSHYGAVVVPMPSMAACERERVRIQTTEGARHVFARMYTYCADARP